MTCNYRVIVDRYKGEAFFQIHEVYYDENGYANSYTENAIAAYSDDGAKDLGKDLRLMAKAIKEPVIWGGDKFPQEYSK